MTLTAEDFRRLAQQADAEAEARREAAAPVPVPAPTLAPAPDSIEGRKAAILAEAQSIAAADAEQKALADAARLVLAQRHLTAHDLPDDEALIRAGLAERALTPQEAAEAKRAEQRAADPHGAAVERLRVSWFQMAESERREAAADLGLDFEEFAAKRLASGRTFA